MMGCERHICSVSVMSYRTGGCSFSVLGCLPSLHLLFVMLYPGDLYVVCWWLLDYGAMGMENLNLQDLQRVVFCEEILCSRLNSELNQSPFKVSQSGVCEGTAEVLRVDDVNDVDFHKESQWLPATVLLPTFFKISSFVFFRRKKLIQVWNNLKVTKWWQNFHFWVNYPFKASQFTLWPSWKCPQTAVF